MTFYFLKPVQLLILWNPMTLSYRKEIPLSSPVLFYKSLYLFITPHNNGLWATVSQKVPFMSTGDCALNRLPTSS